MSLQRISSHRRLAYGLVVLWGLAKLGTVAAQTPHAHSHEIGQRTELKRADVSGAPNMEVIVSKSEYKPGERLPTHIHHGLEAAYVIQGADIELGNQKRSTLPTGASVLQLRDVAHGGFTVVGPQSLQLFTVHVVDKDRPLFDQVK